MTRQLTFSAEDSEYWALTEAEYNARRASGPIAATVSSAVDSPLTDDNTLGKGVYRPRNQTSHDLFEPEVYKGPREEICLRDKPWKVAIINRYSTKKEVYEKLDTGELEWKKEPRQLLKQMKETWTRGNCEVVHADITVESGYQHEMAFWEQAVKKIDSGVWDMLVIGRSDRAGRKVEPVLRGIRLIESAGGEVFLGEMQVTNTSPELTLVSTVLLALSQMKSDVLSVSAKGKMETIRLGWCWPRKYVPPGWQRMDGHKGKRLYPIVPNPTTFELRRAVQRMLDTAPEGIVLESPAARALNLRPSDLKDVALDITLAGYFPFSDRWVQLDPKRPTYGNAPEVEFNSFSLLLRLYDKYLSPTTCQVELSLISDELAAQVGDRVILDNLLDREMIHCDKCLTGKMGRDEKQVTGERLPRIRCKSCNHSLPLVERQTVNNARSGYQCSECGECRQRQIVPITTDKGIELKCSSCGIPTPYNLAAQVHQGTGSAEQPF